MEKRRWVLRIGERSGNERRVAVEMWSGKRRIGSVEDTREGPSARGLEVTGNATHV